MSQSSAKSTAKGTPITNISNVELKTLPPHILPQGKTAEVYQPRMAWISQSLGAKKLGYNITVLAPGKKAFPAHNHHINEEMFMVLEGHGQIQIGEELHDIKEGDVVACPPGGIESAHQITNTGEMEMKYLAVSTKESPEVVEYPDSGKFAILATESPGREVPFRYVGKEEDCLDYWENE